MTPAIDALLAAIAADPGRPNAVALADRLGRPRREVEPLANRAMRQGWLAIRADGALILTASGLARARSLAARPATPRR
jgi:hypothetical protein